MRRRIIELLALIVRRGDDASVPDDHRADGDLVFVEGPHRLFVGQLHEGVVHGGKSGERSGG